MVGKRPRGATIVRSGFAALVTEVKGRIQAAQPRAMLAVNAELVRLCWDIGRIIDERQQREGWGAAVIPQLASELRNELPELKGFSERNIKLMLAFYREYRGLVASSPQTATHVAPGSKGTQPVALLQESVFWTVPWANHVIHHLVPTGIAGCVLANVSMSSSQSGEGEIRKALNPHLRTKSWRV